MSQLSQGTQEGTLLWEPSAEMVERSRLMQYIRWLGRSFATYDELWRWSVDDREGFWPSLAEFFDVPFSRRWTRVLDSHTMPGTHWFDGAELNYVEAVFRHRSAARPALVFRNETTPLVEVSWGHLEQQVAAVGAGLRQTRAGNG